MNNFRDQLASHVIEQKYYVSKHYMETGILKGMKPCPPFVRLMFNGCVQTKYSLDVENKVRVFNSNWNKYLKGVNNGNLS